MAEIVREIRYGELGALLDLYKQLNPDDPVIEDDARLEATWSGIFSDPCLRYIVAEADGKIVSSCALAIIKNPTRGMRPYGIIENMITHSDYRKRGYSTIVLRKAIDIAREQNCYKVMLMTGRKDEETLRFYEQAGFARGVKAGFIATL